VVLPELAIQEQQVQIEILKEELGLKDSEIQTQAVSLETQDRVNSDLITLIQDLRERVEQLENQDQVIIKG